MKGYYYLVDQNGYTVVTGNANYVQVPHVNVVTAEYNQYLHIAAVDVAGNISETTHILIDAKDVLWKLYTKQLVIDASADNVYPATDKSWYVRADGSTPFTLKMRLIWMVRQAGDTNLTRLSTRLYQMIAA